MTFQKTFLGSAFVAALLLGATLPLTAAHAVSISNGSFEFGSYTDGGSGYMTLSAGASNLTDWTISGNSIDWINTYWQAAPGGGNYSLDMSGNGPGSISQLITGLTPGHSYAVSFWLSGNPDDVQNPADTTKTLQVKASAGNSSFTFDIGSNSHSNMNWVEHTFYFLADPSGSTTLQFTSLNDTAYGPALDNVSISETPLPATWIMLLGGLLGFGGLAYRRRGMRAPALTAA